MHERIVAAREIALRALDLDDPRAGIGKPAGADGRRNRLLERDDEEAVKRQHGGPRSVHFDLHGKKLHSDFWLTV